MLEKNLIRVEFTFTKWNSLLQLSVSIYLYQFTCINLLPPIYCSQFTAPSLLLPVQCKGFLRDAQMGFLPHQQRIIRIRVACG